VGRKPKGSPLKEKKKVKSDFLVPRAKVWIERKEVDGEFLLESSNLQEYP
jgi:hypothetical protein